VLIPSYARTGVVSLSGLGGVFLRSFDYSTGQLILEKRLHSPCAGYRLDPDDFGLGTTVAVTEEFPDIFALTCGYTVQRIGESGRVHWVWQSPDNT
jgi:ER membrane protein complex subunit 1